LIDNLERSTKHWNWGFSWSSA